MVYKEIRAVGLLVGVAGKGVMKHESISGITFDCSTVNADLIAYC